MRTAAAAFAALGLALSCTDDFNQFFIERGSAGAPDGATDGAINSGGASSGGAAGTGGTGGTSGSMTGGGGGTGATDSGAAGSPDAATGGAGGSPEAGGAGGCTAGEKDCNGECVVISDPAYGCASADCAACEFPNATPSCVAGACAIGACEPGWGACNPDLDDGCEQPTDAVLEHCGECNRTCATTNIASVECSGGRCASSCAVGWGNCAEPATGADDGCETDVTNDDRHCGGCGNDCVAQGDSSGFSCFASLCTCTAGNQCSSGGNVQCNASGLCVCSGTACRPGETCRQSGPDQACRCNDGPSCAANEVCCHTPAGCRDLVTAADSCGACGRACPTGFTCAGGECQCDEAADCNAGSPGTCNVGRCTCGTASCATGQRCLPDGSCG
jgi:hypothetical protein